MAMQTGIYGQHTGCRSRIRPGGLPPSPGPGPRALRPDPAGPIRSGLPGPTAKPRRDGGRGNRQGFTA
jgi:hypothetical protein